MMKKWKRMFLFGILVSGLFFIWSGECRAWGPPVKEDEDTFLEWYEEHKDGEAPITKQLSGDLFISDEKEEAAVLDGTRHITIDCNGHGIIVQREMVIDNPNLIIQGNTRNGFLMMVNTGGILKLEQGLLRLTGEEGVVLQVLSPNGVSGPSRGGVFTIEGEGTDIQGITWTQGVPIEVSNLNIKVSGSVAAKWLVSMNLRELTVNHCQIQAIGGSESYGIYCRDSVNDDVGRIILHDSFVLAVGLDASARTYSVYHPKGEIRYENSSLEPPVDTGRIYTALELGELEPVYTETGVMPGEWSLPDTVGVYVEETGVEGERIERIPVTWAIPDSAFTNPGYCIVKGTFQDGRLDGKLENPNRIVPEVTVLCLPPEKMFLIAYEVDQDFVRNGVSLVVPYPAGAERMRIEYSADGERFERYEGEGGDILAGIVKPRNHLLYFHIVVPLEAPVYYLRVVVDGDSMFAGTSPVWKIDTGSSEEVPPDVDDDGGGDRGGQDLDPTFPDKEEPSDQTDGAVDEKKEHHTTNSSDEMRTGGDSGSVSGRQSDNEKDSSAVSSSSSVLGASGDNSSNLRQNADSVKRKSDTKAESADHAQYVSASGENEEKMEAATDNGMEKMKKESKDSVMPWILVVLCLFVLVGAGIWCGKKVFFKKQ